VQAAARAEVAPLVPFAPTIVGLEESRRRMERVDSARAAGLLNDLKQQVAQARKVAEAKLAADAKSDKEAVGRAAEAVTRLRGTLKSWFGFFNGYDPVFTWWMGEPYKEADQALQDYAAFLSEKGLRPKPSGDPEPKESPVAVAGATDVPDL